MVVPAAEVAEGVLPLASLNLEGMFFDSGESYCHTHRGGWLDSQNAAWESMVMLDFLQSGEVRLSNDRYILTDQIFAMPQLSVSLG